MAVRVKVGNDRGIAIPEEAMERLRIEPGSHLLVEVRDGYLLLLPEPGDYSRRLRGLHREIWEGVDPDDYVRRERETWAE